MKAMVLTIVGCVGFGLAGSVWATDDCTVGGADGTCMVAVGPGSITHQCTGSPCASGYASGPCFIYSGGQAVSCGCLCYKRDDGGPGGFDPDPGDLP